MNFRKQTGVVAFFIYLGLCAWGALHANAMSIAIGLDWRKNVWLQEMWQDGQPRYLLVNASGKPVSISVHSRPAEGKNDDPLTKIWELPVGDLQIADAKELQLDTLLNFRLGQDRWGLLFSPMSWPKDKEGEPARPKPTLGRFVTFTGLNGSGGTTDGLWIEQELTVFPSGKPFELILKVAVNSGVITFKPAQEPAADGEGNIASPAHLSPEEISCETLPIEKTETGIKIDTSKPKQEAAMHSIKLRFQAPDSPKPEMFMVEAWQSFPDGGGRAIAPGIAVAPAATLD